VNLLKFPVRGQKMRNVVTIESNRAAFSRDEDGQLTCGLEVREVGFGQCRQCRLAWLSVDGVHDRRNQPAGNHHADGGPRE
jgi:hypothetical protein